MCLQPSGPWQLDDLTLTRNSATSGGALLLRGPRVATTATDCTMAHNMHMHARPVHSAAKMLMLPCLAAILCGDVQVRSL